MGNVADVNGSGKSKKPQSGRPTEPASARESWAAQIAEAWRSSVDGVIECGRRLIEAKAALPGEFEAMIEADLPFGARTARKLMAIARCEFLIERTHESALPPSWTTLHALSQLQRDDFEAMVSDGTVHPEMDRGDISQFLKRAQRAGRERELATRTAEAAATLNRRLYGIILADPPWRFEPYSRRSGMDRAADNHYPTMTIEGLKALQIPGAPDCALFLWATIPMLPQALDVMASWGFAYRSQFVWVKDKFGTGYWTREQHELLLIGIRGEVSAPAQGEQYASVILASRGLHSAKPPVVYEMIEEMFPTVPRLEMFARGEGGSSASFPPGWDQWGNEAPVEAAA